MEKEIPSIHPELEIVTSRIVNAARPKAYLAWADPDHLKNWWGPAGFSNTFFEFDFKVGGKWDFTMHGPEKGNYHNLCEFTGIQEPALIAWTRISKPLFDVIVTFEEIESDKTRVVFRQVFETAEECNKIRPFVEDKNEENMDKLEAELNSM